MIEATSAASFPVRDPTLHTTAPVRARAELAVALGVERVVVLAAVRLGALKARADLEGLGGGDAEHGVRELRLELVEDGLSKAAWNPANDAGDGAADGVGLRSGRSDELENDGYERRTGRAEGRDVVHRSSFRGRRHGGSEWCSCRPLRV